MVQRKAQGSPWLSHKTMGFPFRKKKKKKTLSFSNLLPKLYHPNTNKGHVTAAKRSPLPFTCRPGHRLSNSQAAPKKCAKCKQASKPKSPSLPCSSQRLPRLEPLAAWHNPTSNSCFHVAFRSFSALARAAPPAGTPGRGGQGRVSLPLASAPPGPG